MTTTTKQCECGAALGEACNGTLGSDAVTIEWMPDDIRGSIKAAGGSGWSADALRLRVTPQCAAHLERHDGEWTRRV